MLERLRAWLQGDGADDTAILHRQLKQLHEELQDVEWQQQRLQQRLDEDDGVRPETVAIEEKVDVTRLSEEIERLRQEATAGIEQRTAPGTDAEDAPARLEAAVEQAVDGLREEMQEAFHRELVALETVLSYEMDALEARQGWERDELADRIEAVREAVQEDVAGVEGETIALLELNTARLEDKLDAIQDRLAEAHGRMEDEMEGAFDALEADGEVDTEAAQEAVSGHLAAAIERVREEDIRPLEEAVAAVREEVDERVDAYGEELAAVRERVREQEEQRASLREDVQQLADRLGQLSTDLSTVQEGVDGIASADDLAAVRSRVEELRADIDDRVAADAVDELGALVDALQDRMATLEEGKADVETLQDAMEEVSEDVGGVQDDLIAIGTKLRDRLEELSADTVDEEAFDRQMETLAEAIDGARQHIEAVQDRFEQEVETLAEGKADSTRVDAAFEEVRGDIGTMKETLADIGERVERLKERKADRSELEDAVGTVTDDLRTLQDRVDSMQNTLGHRVEVLAEEKADRETVTEQLDTLAEGVRTVRERLQESRDTLTARLDELEDAAARAESVNDIHRHINALDDEAEARQTAVREALKEIHAELNDLRDQHLTQQDIDELQHRVQTIRERQERTIDPKDVVSRDEFRKLRSTMEDLMDLVMRVLNRDDR